MANILFDCSMLSKPYGLKRCTHQLLHMAMIAKRLGHNVKLLTNAEHLSAHRFLRLFANDILEHDVSIRSWSDIYIAKSDTFYRDYNWRNIEDINSFKVCLCNSDKCFRESSTPYRTHQGTPIFRRCDLYMPVNHTDKVLAFTHVMPTIHPIDPRIVRLFRKLGLYESYLDDDVFKIRSRFGVVETGKLGFMGSRRPTSTRESVAPRFPKWVDFRWSRTAPAASYISWIMERRGCLDLRGYGDKSLRFTEAALLGRTIVTPGYVSQHTPPLINQHNCVIYSRESDIYYDRDKWLDIASNMTNDYITHGSMRAQVRYIIAMAGA